MPRVNIWLPAELHKRVKALEVPISEVCQRALTAEVRKQERRQLSTQDASDNAGVTIRRQ